MIWPLSLNSSYGKKKPFNTRMFGEQPKLKQEITFSYQSEVSQKPFSSKNYPGSHLAGKDISR